MKCEHHDYIEIVCMYRYPIKLTLHNGDEIDCTARDTGFDDSRQECIKVEQGGTEKWIVLDNIAALAVCVENPHFDKVDFTC